MGEMAAIRMFMKLRAFDQIPFEGSISYKELADSLGAEENLISTDSGPYMWHLLTLYSSFCMDDGCNR
jgi:hypothetical protein